MSAPFPHLENSVIAQNWCSCRPATKGALRTSARSWSAAVLCRFSMTGDHLHPAQPLPAAPKPSPNFWERISRTHDARIEPLNRQTLRQVMECGGKRSATPLLEAKRNKNSFEGNRGTIKRSISSPSPREERVGRGSGIGVAPFQWFMERNKKREFANPLPP
jgi:hypothetical protein